MPSQGPTFKSFRKRTFTMPLLARSLGAVLLRVPVLAVATVRPSVPRALREKVMLGVNSVNGCRYCNWAHTGLALAHGVDLDELADLLDTGTFGEVDERDGTAILFAQCFADTVRNPTPEAQAALAKRFTPYERRELMAYIHAIYLGSLCGNCADAWLTRLSGRKVDDGHPVPEAIAALLAAPALFSGWLRSRTSRRQAMGDL
jgi:AhpD family alkylhydroperoxidase